MSKHQAKIGTSHCPTHKNFTTRRRFQQMIQHLQHPESLSWFLTSFRTSALLRLSGGPSNGGFSSAAFLASTTRRTIRLKVCSIFTLSFALVSMKPMPRVRAHVKPSAEEIARWLAKSHLFPAMTFTLATGSGNSSVVT